MREKNQPEKKVGYNQLFAIDSHKGVNILLPLGHLKSIFLTYLQLSLFWNLSQSSIRPSIYFSLIVKSHLNLFLEPTSAKQYKW